MERNLKKFNVLYLTFKFIFRLFKNNDPRPTAWQHYPSYSVAVSIENKWESEVLM